MYRHRVNQSILCPLNTGRQEKKQNIKFLSSFMYDQIGVRTQNSRKLWWLLLKSVYNHLISRFTSWSSFSGFAVESLKIKCEISTYIYKDRLILEKRRIQEKKRVAKNCITTSANWTNAVQNRVVYITSIERIYDLITSGSSVMLLRKASNC